MRHLLQIFVLCVLAGVCPGGPYILVDTDLNESAVELVQVRDSGLLVRDESSRRVPMERFVAILRDVPGDSRAVGGVVQLADGQRLVSEGAPLGRGESIRVLLRSRAEVIVPLESVGWMRLPGAGDLPASAAPPETDPFDDTVVLANNDTLRGFVLGIDGETLRIEAETGVRSVSLSEIAWVVLSTPQADRRGPMLWLSDGSVLSAATLESESPTELTITLRGIDPSTASQEASAAGTLRVQRDEVLALLPDPGRVVSLARLEGVSVRPLGDRRWAPAPQSPDRDGAFGDLASVTLSGPVEARWPLPNGARRFGATIETPPEARAWADSEVVILATRGRGEEAMPLARLKLSQRSEPQRISVGLPSGRDRELIVRVESGRYGPVHAGAVLRRAVLLLGD
ncbi:MAG: hypothetical protein JJU33_04880 [Phycisphaerales bacterium]|nr:hypothetical protein [Phycisphaerales bacterium]